MLDGEGSDVNMEDGTGGDAAVTPSKQRRTAEAAERKAMRDRRKAQEGVLSGKREGLEKAKVGGWSVAQRQLADWNGLVARRLDEALQLPPRPDRALPALYRHQARTGPRVCRDARGRAGQEGRQGEEEGQVGLVLQRCWAGR